MVAASHWCLSVLTYLLAKGADPQRRDGLDETPRDAASRRGFAPLCKQFDAAKESGALARLAAELRAAPEPSWSVKSMRALLAAARVE